MASPSKPKLLPCTPCTPDSPLSPSGFKNNLFADNHERNSYHYRVSSSPACLKLNVSKPEIPYDFSSPKSSISKQQRDQDRKITNIINDCVLMQDELIGAWKSAATAVKSHKKHLKFMKAHVFSAKFNSFLQDEIFSEKKNKIKESAKQLNQDSTLTLKHRKVKSLLTSPKRSGSSTRLPSPDGLLNQKSEQVFVTAQDLSDYETAKLVSLNRRVFGENFGVEIKDGPQRTREKRKSMININDISPEQTIMADLKSYLHRKNQKKHKTAEKMSEPDLKAKLEEQKQVEKIPSMSPLNQYIFSEWGRMMPRNCFTSENIRHKSLPEKKDEEKPKQPKAEPEISNTSKYTAQKRISQINYSEKKDLTKQDLELINDIKQEANDNKLRRRVRRFVTQRQHVAYVHKEMPMNP
ncbi:unnamed protein product [Blepharisma stoltei]|uniref:Uncharacterized protein n=1 Tax=Blepharisma stoltei TaxID=1481888 RepID=A0AAU9IS59_9CILI|nr:unnamed protein product [Blepharisma stoltei]